MLRLRLAGPTVKQPGNSLNKKAGFPGRARAQKLREQRGTKAGRPTNTKTLNSCRFCFALLLLPYGFSARSSASASCVSFCLVPSFSSCEAGVLGWVP